MRGNIVEDVALDKVFMKKINEENACSAFLEIFPYITGVRYDNKESPDERNSDGPDVDYLLTPRSPKLPLVVVEHTILESFEGEMTYVIRSHDIVKEIDATCHGKLPVDRYFILVIPDTLVHTLRKSAKTQFVEDVSLWVVSEAKKLKHDDYIAQEYKEHNIILMCGGSHPDINGTVGRMPTQPKHHIELREERLWISISHGLGKFQKYKLAGYDTVLLLEDISGAFHTSALQGNEIAAARRRLVNALVDYIVVFASHNNRMIVGNIWKEKQSWYAQIPYNRRFHEAEEKWKPLA